MTTRSIALLSTGGTIEKTYDPFKGMLANEISVLDVMLSQLELEGITLHRMEVMNKDSLEMTEEDHEQICAVALEASSAHDGVVIVHGTDRLAVTGELIVRRAKGSLGCAMVLTGAMRPWILRTTDAMQNVTEALMAVQLLDPGVYVCMHNQVLQFPGVRKDRERHRFVRQCDRKQEVIS